MMRVTLWVGIAAVLLNTACQRVRFIYEVPNGYVGWVNVSFNTMCRDDVSNLVGNVIKVRRDGSACSRLSMRPRTTWEPVYYVDEHEQRIRELPQTGWGDGGMVWAPVGSLDHRTYRFFIGTEQQLRDSWRKLAQEDPAKNATTNRARSAPRR